MRDLYLLERGLARNSNEETMFLARNQESFANISKPASKHIESVWSEAKRLGVSSGPLFEMIVGSVLYSLEIGPFYRRAALRFVPELDIDFILFNEDETAPICLQLTSTLRERHKLADLQAFKIKHFYPKAFFSLLTMDSIDVARKSGVKFPSLDMLVDAGSTQFDELMVRIGELGATRFANSALASSRSSTFHSLSQPYTGPVFS